MVFWADDMNPALLWTGTFQHSSPDTVPQQNNKTKKKEITTLCNSPHTIRRYVMSPHYATEGVLGVKDFE